MPHDVSLIATLAAGFGLAMVFGLIATKLRLPSLVGYLLAGILIGPATPGFVADVSLATQLAEVGVILLMFGVGLHFSMADLLAVKRIAIPGAIVQIGSAVLLGAAVGNLWGWDPFPAIVFGLALSVASTVVLLRALEARGLLNSINGQITVGWLIVEDLVMVLALVLLPALAEVFVHSGGQGSENGQFWQQLGMTMAKVAGFILIMVLVGRRLLPKLLLWMASTGSRELFTLSVIAIAIGTAFGAAALFDVSFALGAFFAGMMMRESEFSHRAADESLPLRDAFAVLFFVAVGMLFDPSILWEEPAKVVSVVTIILVGKTLAAVAIVLLFRYPLNTALIVGVSLAQIGEFSFILAGLGVTLGVLSEEARSLVLAGAMISIAANPALFSALDPARRWMLEKSDLARRFDRRDDPLSTLPSATDEKLLTGQVVLVGHGRVGSRIRTWLTAARVPHIVAEQNRDVVASLRAEGVPAVAGDAATEEVLIQAHVKHAAMLVIAVPDTVSSRRMVTISRTLNPAIQIAVRVHSEDEAKLFGNDSGCSVFFGEAELARGMSDHIRDFVHNRR